MIDRQKVRVEPGCAYDGEVGSTWEECLWGPTAIGVWAAEAAVEVLKAMEFGPRLRWDWGDLG